MDDTAPVGRRIVGKDSPLRRLPISLPPRQHFDLGALSVAAQMADHAYGHLEALAALATQLRIAREVEPDVPPLMLEAWGVLDAIYKARTFVQRIGGWELNAPSSAFVAMTRDVWDIRDTYQHLSGMGPKMIEAAAPAMGTLSWLAAFPDVQADRFYGCIVVPGSIWQESSIPSRVQMPSPERELRVPVDDFRLGSWRPARTGRQERGPAGPVELNISDLLDGLYGAVTQVERSIRHAVEASGSTPATAASDLMFLIALDSRGQVSGSEPVVDEGTINPED
jgi:hypothetical protein